MSQKKDCIKTTRWFIKKTTHITTTCDKGDWEQSLPQTQQEMLRTCDGDDAHSTPMRGPIMCFLIKCDFFIWYVKF